MKTTLAVISFCISGLVAAQQADTMVVKYTLDSLYQLSRNCILKHEYENAAKFNALAEKLAFEHLGPHSISYGRCCLIKGKLHYHKGDYKETEKCYLSYSSILLNAKGEDHMDYAWSLDDLGQLYGEMGQFEMAEPLLFKSGSIIAKINGKNHPDYAWSLNDLAILYRNMGSYEKAEPLYLEAKSIRENAMGKNHPDYAWSLNNLANLYNFMGSYEKAEPYYLEAMELWLVLYGNESSQYASGINNLASLYFNMGIYQKAEHLLIESCKLREKLLGKQSADYSGSLNNLASLYMEIGNYQKAEPLYLEALSIREKIYGNKHAEYANTIGNLGVLYDRTGNHKNAESFYLEAKSIWEQAVGQEHPEYASSLFNLAIFYLERHQLERADSLLQSTMMLREKLLGIEHPDFLENQRVLGKLYVKKGLYVEAISLFRNVSNKRTSELMKATSYLSEHELSQFISTYQNQEDALGSYYYSCPTYSDCPISGKWAELAYDHALFYKGFLLTSAVRSRNLAESTEESKAIYYQLKSYQRRLAYEYTLPIQERNSIPELEKKANATEKELAHILAGYSEAVKQVKWQDVQLHLKKDEAALEFVHFELNFPQATDRIMYVALILKEDTKEPILIPLFEERSLDSLFNSSTERKADYVNALYTIADRGAAEIKTPGRSLYDLLWKPLEKELHHVKTIYFSSSGLLHRINLEAIPISVPNGIGTETLADHYQMIHLNSTRQLVIPASVPKANNEAVLYGGIQYESDSSLQTNEPSLALLSRSEFSFHSVDSSLRGGSWQYLSGTAREVNSIAKMLQTSGINVHMNKDFEATEESFKKIGTNHLPTPRILHVATHGYFFADPKTNSQKSIVNSQSESVFKMSGHPMLRSGLILAASNAAWQGNKTPEGREDGILTAYEISQMNLSNTELVVLSACETGLGDIQGNEGVYGLQRAFKIAGAKYLIMSLWQVPDKQTSLLMTTFYKKWLENKMTIPDAFHAAQKQLRDGGLEPYYWAGFVLVE